jgi:hypothetical protein
MCSLTTETLREWVARGEWPEPHAVIERTWFYQKSIIDHFLEKGEWPEGTRFKPGEGRGRVTSDA